MTAAAHKWATAPPMSEAAPLPPKSETPRDRLATVARAELDFVWRMLRRQGLSRADADDGAQRVFLLFREKMAGVAPGAEKGFLFRAAGFVAKELRRAAGRCEEPTDANMGAAASPSGRIELDDLLAKVMRDLDDDERSVFLLFEVEGLTMAEIAPILQCPSGTVASRLRRARDKVRAAALRLETVQGGAR